MVSEQRYKRVLLKLSGEGLMGEREFGLDLPTMEKIALDIKAVTDLGTEVSIVIGGGNIFRGVAGVVDGLERNSADHMGMLATIINALGVQSVLEATGVNTRILSAIPMATVCEPYIRRRAIRHMEKGRVVIFAAGTGNPFFTTDTAAALRAAEMNCNALMKGTQVDGVYNADPLNDPTARHYDSLGYKDILTHDLKVMDASAVSLARENNIPIVVFSIHTPGAFLETIKGRGKFTLISEDKEED
ncbi:MAG: UMP kinase [Pseudomonadota bacterium]|nr:UMP kinase [Pseudomonadota bacterium]